MPGPAPEAPTPAPSAQAPPRSESVPAPEALTTASQDRQFVGTFRTGEGGNVASCGFAPGSQVQLELNGVGIGSDDVDARGCTAQQLDVTGLVGVAMARPGLVGMARPGLVGVAGLRGFAQTVRASTASIAIDGRPYRARIGDNALVVGGVDPQRRSHRVTNIFRIDAPAAEAAGGGLARTGLELAKWSVIGGLLVALGVALVVPGLGRNPESTVQS